MEMVVNKMGGLDSQVSWMAITCDNLWLQQIKISSVNIYFETKVENTGIYTLTAPSPQIVPFEDVLKQDA